MKKSVHAVSGLVLGLAWSWSAFASTASDNKAAAKVISQSLNSTEAEAILDATYDGFVEIRGKARQDRFEFKKVKSKASFPDKRWEETAQELLEQINVPVNTASASGKQRPSATAYVYFYKDGVEGVNTAGARQFNVMDGEGDYMAMVVIREKAPRSNVRLQSGVGSYGGSAESAKKVYKFEVDV